MSPSVLFPLVLLLLKILHPSNGADDEDDPSIWITRLRNVDCGSIDHVIDLPLLQAHPYLCFNLFYNQKNKTTLMKPEIEALAGSNVTVYCSVRGRPPPKISWYKDDTLLQQNTSSSYSISDQGITFSNSSVADSGFYRCEASNDGVRSRMYFETRLYITLLTVPLFLEFPSNTTAPLGSKVTLSVKVLSEPAYSVEWLKNNDREGKGKTAFHSFWRNVTRVVSRTSNVTIKNDDHFLVFDNVTLDDGGWYTVVVGNYFGRNQHSFYINVTDTVHHNEIIVASSSASETTSILYIIGILGTIMTLGFLVAIGIFFWKKRIVILQQQQSSGVENSDPVNSMQFVRLENEL